MQLLMLFFKHFLKIQCCYSYTLVHSFCCLFYNGMSCGNKTEKYNYPLLRQLADDDEDKKKKMQ